ncbi:MAG: NAD(+) synthase [Bacilli bacterium]|nr:NAD(+) synthase [Bacilli bacterium]
MKLEAYLKKIEQFVSDYLINNNMDKYILGLSGGVDSSLVAAICKKAVGKDKLLCVMIPIDSDESDLRDAKKVAEILDLNYIIFDASETFHKEVERFNSLNISLDKSTLANLKVRIRMTVLYALAQKERGLVVGTDNADERYTGYFTKYGDGGVDLLPIGHLLKSEVVQACKLYGLPKDLAERIPSAGLWEGQTDEGEMGITYKVLDDFLLGKPVDESSQARINHLHKISQHKRDPLPMPEEFIRD